MDRGRHADLGPDRNLAVFGSNCRYSADVQVAVNADARQVVTADRPLPGVTADPFRNGSTASHRPPPPECS
ncbi:hypothetical protein EAO75_30410 [Streptomyces sp. uw30]|nr:hypothetical protein EAO75_30410 [Streptomyces sp. uw30]